MNEWLKRIMLRMRPNTQWAGYIANNSVGAPYSAAISRLQRTYTWLKTVYLYSVISHCVCISIKHYIYINERNIRSYIHAEMHFVCMHNIDCIYLNTEHTSSRWTCCASTHKCIRVWVCATSMTVRRFLFSTHKTHTQMCNERWEFHRSNIRSFDWPNDNWQITAKPFTILISLFCLCTTTSVFFSVCSVLTQTFEGEVFALMPTFVVCFEWMNSVILLAVRTTLKWNIL